MIIRKLIVLFVALLLATGGYAKHYQPEFSTAGFYQIADAGRHVFSMNPAWRIHVGEAIDAESTTFDDSKWKVTSLPDGIELLPLDASGCVNYQGVVWYRKHFTPQEVLKGKKLFLHFEAIMGKSRIYVNGKLIKENFTGYYPITVDITESIEWGKSNTIAVWADNSDDTDYPPGKFQDVLDFTYFGGIYRDCWLIAHDKVYITEPTYENEVAGGGLFVAYDKVSKASADILLQLHLRNETKVNMKGKVEFDLQTLDGKSIAKKTQSVSINANEASHFNNKMTIANPNLWSPNSPTLYNMVVKVKDNKGRVIDGYRQKIGIRSFEFKGIDGFWLNGEPYPEAVIGGNRHQDYAIVGNAVANSAHWRDAKKIREAGMTVIRNAHYPQDPAFMDACDELGLLLIENIPGWQYWNPKPIFEERIYRDIRQMVRRDRNRPSVWMWEPVLNETRYPESFAKKAEEIVHEEYPYPYCHTVADSYIEGSKYFSALYSHPTTGDTSYALKASEIDLSKVYFTREWGDNVDDWSAQNSSSRIARSWGEQHMLVQAKHYEGHIGYSQTSYTALRNTNRQHIGGALWHSFDHQRGYHPDPFYGGIMDAFRQPKYSYYMFQAQSDPRLIHPIAKMGPMVYIANEMTPGSSKDVVIYSNCDEVKFVFNEGEKTYTHVRKNDGSNKLQSPTIIIEDVFDFMKTKYQRRKDGTRLETAMLAEGYIDGKLVATHKVTNAKRPTKIKLWVDDENMKLQADGSDFVTVIAAIVDSEGNIKRLNNNIIKFEIEGEGELIGDASIFANPTPLRWGTAPILLRSTTKAGKIKIIAKTLFEGSRTPLEGSIELETVTPTIPLLYDASEITQIGVQAVNCIDRKETRKIDPTADTRLKQVEKQQADFGEESKSDM